MAKGKKKNQEAKKTEQHEGRRSTSPVKNPDSSRRDRGLYGQPGTIGSGYTNKGGFGALAGNDKGSAGEGFAAGQSSPPSGTESESESGEVSDDNNALRMPVDAIEQGPWAREIIQKEIANVRNSNPIISLFQERGFKRSQKKIKLLFEKLNRKIVSENRKNNYTKDVEKTGVIKYPFYFGSRESWIATLEKVRDGRASSGKAWTDFDHISATIAEFNENHHLRNLNVIWAENIRGKQNAPPPANRRSTNRNAPPRSTTNTDDDDDEDDEDDDDEDDDAADLQSLKIRAGRSRTKNGAASKVLYWWKTGKHGEDCFVQYGPDGRCVHRIESSDYHSFDRETLPRIQTKNRLTNAKDEVMGGWKYTEDNVDKLLAVGWKIPVDYDPAATPLQHILPEYVEPHLRTEILVRWKDGETSLEPRGGLRRLVRNKRLADEIIYEMAEKREKKFESSKARQHGGRSDSGRSVRFDDPLSEYSFGWCWHRGHSGRGDPPSSLGRNSRAGSSRSHGSRRDRSPTRTSSSHGHQSTKTKVGLSHEIKRLKEMVRQLEKDRGSVILSDSETDSDY